MAFQLTEGVIIGIAVGGGCVLFGIMASIVIFVLRARHKHMLARMDAHPERRSRRLSGIFNITDQDVARMPGTRSDRHGSLDISYRRSPYTPMSSRDTFDSRQALTKSSGLLENHQENNRNERSYSVPTRLRRSSKRQKIKKRSKSVALSPITERHTSSATLSPSTRNTLRLVSASSTINPTIITPSLTSPQTAPTGIETPKPLFHSERKLSYSNPPNTLPKSFGARRTSAGLHTMDVIDTTPRPLEGIRPRSHSLHNGGSGLVSSHCPPPIPSHAPQIAMLPWELVPSKLERNNSKKSTKAKCLSDESVMSANTSLLDDEKPRGFSQVLSIGIPSPTIIEPPISRFERPDASREFKNIASVQEQGIAQPFNQVLVSCPPEETQQQFHSETRGFANKTPGSLLTIKVDEPLKNGHSVRDTVKAADYAYERKDLANSKIPARDNPTPNSSQKVTASHSTIFQVHEDLDVKPSSSLILQPTSGNRKSPILSPGTTVRSSIATDTSYEWDFDNPLPVAKSRLSLHKRHTLFQASQATDTVERKPIQSLKEELERTQLSNDVSATKLKKQRKPSADFKPPSTLTFDPQFANMPGSESPKMERHSTSLAGIPRYEGCSSPEMEIYTPTRKPSNRMKHHRYKSIIGHPGMTAWPFSSTAADTAFDNTTGLLDPSKPNIFRQSFQQIQQEERDFDSRPSSFSIPKFPTPPPKSPVRRLPQPNWRGPKTPIRHPIGPRQMLPSTSKIPVRQRSPLRVSITRRSPTRVPGVGKPRGHSASKSKSISPSKIHGTISALRRMNSEANTEATLRGSKEHKRYQSIGEDVFESEAFEDADVLGRGKENARESLIGPRAMPLTGYVEKVSTESSRYNLFAEGQMVGSYDDKGFLREDLTSGFDF